MKFIQIGLSFLIVLIITKNAGIDIYGQIALLAATGAVISSIMELRTNEAVLRFFVREMTTGHKDRAYLVIFLGLFADIIIAILVFVFFLTLAPIISKYFLKNLDLENVVRIFGLVISFRFISGTPLGFFQSIERFKTLNYLYSQETIFRVLGLILILVLQLNIKITSLVLLYVIAGGLNAIISLFLMLLVLFRMDFRMEKLKYNIILIKEFITFSCKSFFSTLTKSGYNNIDRLLLGYFFNTTSVGIYDALKKIGSILGFVGFPLPILTYGKMVRLQTNSKLDDLKRLIIHSTKLLTIVNLGFSFVIILALFPILQYMKIPSSRDILISMCIILFQGIISGTIWWGRNFTNIFNPLLPIATNILLSLNLIWIMFFLKHITEFSPVLLMSTTSLLAYIPSYCIGIGAFKYYLKNSSGYNVQIF